MMEDNDIHIEQLEWVAIPPELKAGLSLQPLSKKKQKNWALVLYARSIPCKTAQTEIGRQLLVPADHFRKACEELKKYEHENRNWPPPPPPDRKLHENTASTLWVFILLALFHNLTVQGYNPLGSYRLDWVEQGAAQAGTILDGEWWRLVTALTLHSGPLHLFGNIIAGAIFCTRICWILGSGWAWFLILLSGVSGNLINTLVQSPSHSSIGASTAVFAAVGLLATLNMLHFRQSLWRRWPLPVAAALGLLALLGTGGDNTDVGAHLFGFVAGTIIAMLTHLLFVKIDIPKKALNGVFAILTPLLVILSWWMAIA
jgi:membrane associated rhomboid family serine protease